MRSLSVVHRPTDLNYVIGQSSVTKILQRQAEKDEVKNCYLFCGASGCGKAQPLTSRVLTPNGYEYMGELEVGQEVIDGEGNKTKILAIFPQGQRDIYTISLSDGTSFEVADNHLNSVYRVYDNGKRVDMVMDTLSLLKYQEVSNEKFAIEVPYITSFKSKKHRLSPYLLGVSLVSATIENNFIYYRLTSDVADKIDDLLQNTFGVKLEKRSEEVNLYCVVSHTNQQKVVRYISELKRIGFSDNTFNRYISDEYLISSANARLELLQGIIDSIGRINYKKYARYSFKIDSLKLSNDISFLARTLGIKVVKKAFNIETKADEEKRIAYRISMHAKNSAKLHTVSRIEKKWKQNFVEPVRYIESIKFDRKDICQCIYVESPCHTYITDNVTITHNTTVARAFSNAINKGAGKPIEIDAASNNGVDNIRQIISEAKERAIDGKYKIYIVDECVTGETEILTDKGWVRFDSLEKNEKVAQYNDDGSIEFVKPYEYIERDYNGTMYDVKMDNRSSFLMSPNHVQPLLNIKSNKIEEFYIKDIKFEDDSRFIKSGYVKGSKKDLSAKDKAIIALQVRGDYKTFEGKNSTWYLFAKEHSNINEYDCLLSDSGLYYKKLYNSNCCCFDYTISVEGYVTEKFSSYFNLSDIDSEYAEKLLKEIAYWDGSLNFFDMTYYCRGKDNIDFIQGLCAICGYSSKVYFERGDYYRIYFYKETLSEQILSVSKKEVEFSGKIYCVKVPSHKIVIRKDDCVIVTGNCHMLTIQSWNALLKLLEEPPTYTVFIFCTTDPQKIPATILNRVQRFNFARISSDKIRERLKHICIEEGFTNYNESIDYISKISDGGMRTAISLLEKSASYSTSLSIENTIDVVGGSPYEYMFSLVNGMIDGDEKTVLSIVEEIYNNGSDLKLFVDNFLDFCIDLDKFILFNSFDCIKIPKSMEKSVRFAIGIDGASKYYSYLIDKVLSVKSEIKNETNIKSVIEVMFLQICRGK